MSWLMGLLLVCSGPLASGCDAACQLQCTNSCCHSALSNECRMLQCPSSTACNGTMHQTIAEIPALRDRLLQATPVSADLVPARCQPPNAVSQSTMQVRSRRPSAKFLWIRSPPGQPANLERHTHPQMSRVEWVSPRPFDCHPNSSCQPASLRLGFGHRIIE